MSRLAEHPELRGRVPRMQTVTTLVGTEPGSLERQADELLATLASLHELLKQLLELAGRKLQGLRRADTQALQHCAAQEGTVLQAIFEREKKRDAVLAGLAQGLHWPPGTRLRLSKIVDGLPEPFGSRLRAKTAGLRQTAAALKEKNHLAGSVARDLHEHIRAVFDDVARLSQESIVYGPSGKHEQRNKQTWVDAVG